MSDAELRGRQVLLRPSVTADRERLLAIRTTPEVAAWWDPPPPDWPANDAGTHRYTVVTDHRIIGFVQWYENSDPEYAHAGLDLFLDSAVHGRGLGRDVVQTVLRHLLDDVGHHRVVIDPAASNAAAIACYRACGFREVGVMRWYELHVASGRWRDGLLMEYAVDPAGVRPGASRE